MNKYSFEHTIQPRKGSNDALLIQVLDGLMSRYLDRVPDANRAVSLFTKKGDQIINDHIAFRSIHIESILKIFLHLGYTVRMNDATNRPFNFESKKLTAVWLKHKNENAPRIFVSQFRFTQGSKELQNIVSAYLSNWKDPIDQLDLNDANAINEYLHTAQWPTPTYADYKAIQEESEYVSWVLYNKYYLNHFTLSVHELASFEFNQELNIVLKNYQDSYKRNPEDSVLKDARQMMKRKYKKQFFEFNQMLIDHGFNMNKVKDGVMNISEDACLLQSSTQSAMVNASFPDGDFLIPGSYVEFAYRGINDNIVDQLITNHLTMADVKPNMRRDGFETQNADNIFESTYIGVQKKGHESKSAYEESCQNLQQFLLLYGN